MPKTKKETMKHKKQRSSKKPASRRQKKLYIRQILEERRLEGTLLKQTANVDKEMAAVDKLHQEEVTQLIGLEDDDIISINSDDIIIDSYNYGSNYNIPFEENSYSDLTKLCLQRLQIMSVEENELEANIHFNHLMKANWSPVFDDVRNILCKWRADLDTLTSGSSLKYEYIGRHNFELVINFIFYSILKNNKKFSVDELLTIAKFIVTLSLDQFCEQMLSVIKRLFSACIETALEEDNGSAIIDFAQELYSKYKDNLLNMMVDLFLPLQGQIMKKMYTYLTYKLYKSFLGQTDNTSAFPSSINGWFIQDLVDKNFFNKNPKKVLYSVIQMLEHVVVVFELHKEEEKLQNMYDFLNAAAKQIGFSGSMQLINILDQWRLQLFRLHMIRIAALHNEKVIGNSL